MPPVAPAATDSSTSATPTTTKPAVSPAQTDENASVRLHITPFTPTLLKSYLAPSVLPLAKNISFHHVETFPERGFGYLELPIMEAQKLKKKLNGATLKGSKVKIETAKPEKRKSSEDAEAVKENEERPAKRAKKAKKEQGVLEGVELPADRKVKRGWTEPVGKNKKDKRDKKDKKESKTKQKESKYTKEPEMLFKAKLTAVAATEVAHKEKKEKKDKKKEKEDKKDKKKSRSKLEVTVHEFKKNKKEPSFLRSTKVSTEKKPPVEYINGKGWVDEDGNVVEAETGKARNRRVLELVDSLPPQPTTEKKPSATPEPTPSPKSASKTKPSQKAKAKKATPPPSSSESDVEESSVVSSSSENEASESEAESKAESSTSSPAPPTSTPQIDVTPSSPEERKEVHPLEALFKRPRPPPLTSPTASTPTSAPAKGLAPINTSFSFFDNNEPMDVDAGASENAPATPYTQRDLEWRGLRSAAPTPDTAAIGRRFSFPWRKGSQEVDDEDPDDDIEAGKQLSNNTKANSSLAHLPGLMEEDEDEDENGTSDQNKEDEDSDADAGADADMDANQKRLGPRTRSTSKKIAEGEEGEAEESEFGKWFWENRGENNRAWKKRRRETLKAKRLRDNKKMTTGGRVV
ncbi:hypothetical protein K505DRAFT_330630 [Melanomma pulvis-pyrius CBS 109.77]|uniref:Uncharacterized protein n=1 Tax=Melanomma pulvis-pyrius CBS 109.77 TaxID=1314802 RepID=A0A6A6WPJ6_9PLEO|nr:hypothetical protein K505DRAFT_330630 [Melanomma pulvis-pyrius CBS 109.77]